MVFQTAHKHLLDFQVGPFQLISIHALAGLDQIVVVAANLPTVTGLGDPNSQQTEALDSRGS